jgi:hypothetical protein
MKAICSPNVALEHLFNTSARGFMDIDANSKVFCKGQDTNLLIKYITD